MINLNIPTKLDVKEAQNLVQELQEKIRLEKIEQSKILEAKVREETTPEYLEELQTTLKSLYKNLNRKDFPQHIICSHFGVGRSVGNDYLQMSIHQSNFDKVTETFKTQNLLITLYRSQNQFYPDSKQVGYTQKELDLRKKAIVKALGGKTLDSWNGLEGQNGISLVLDNPVPKSLILAITNYHNLGVRVFDLTKKDETGFSNFEKWVNGYEK